MLLSKKIILIVLFAIFFIAITNIVGFYIFYGTYLKVFLAEKNHARSEVSLDYINSIILKSEEEKQNNEIDNIFNSDSLAFFEKLGNDNKISLDKKENIDIIINYLVKKGVAPKYIEEAVPTNNFEKVLGLLKNKKSPEYRFIKNIFISIILINIFGILIISIIIFIIGQKMIGPIRKATKQIKDLKPGKKAIKIDYPSQDEIGLLVNSINSLNKKISLQDTIKNKLLADISHELKTPITSIQCYLEGIIDGIIKLDEKNLTSITNEMQRLIKLVNKIMNFEKFDNNSLNLKLEEKNISDILKKVVETHKKRLKENKQKIKISGDENLLINLDENSFIQLTHNLIGNFLKYSGKNSSMNINITKKYIDFADNGKGIKKNEIPYLMEKFYQGDISKAEDIDMRGIGIGLSIVGKIIMEHNWNFKINSDINSGFSFKIYF